MRRTPGADVSVAMATYNGERFIEEQILSILHQSEPPSEIVICDDGSADATVEIVKRIATSIAGPTEVRIAATERVGGVTANFERAIRACRGEIIALSDQDDRWHADRLASVVRGFEHATQPRLVFSNAALIDAFGAPLGRSLHRGIRLGRGEARSFATGRPLDVLIRRNVVTGATVAFSRSLVPLALPLPPSWVHDEWLAIIAAALGTVVLEPRELLDYRLHDSNQIGVDDPSSGARARRMMMPRGDRHARLYSRSVVLAERLEDLGAPPTAIALAQRKVAFERARAAYAPERARRLGAVARGLLSGGYSTFSSQRRLDAVRDVLQPR